MLGKRKSEEKIINIEATMKGNLVFNDPVNLKISGKFEGELETKGTLIIGEQAEVKTKVIKGENIKILGKVKGDVICSNRLELFPPGLVIGNIQAPILIIKEGASLKGYWDIPAIEEKKLKKHPKKK